MKYGAFEKELGKELEIWFNERNFQLIPNVSQWDLYKEEKTYTDYIFVGRGNQWRPKMNCITLTCARKLNRLESLIQEFKFPKQGGIDHTFGIQSTERNIFVETRKCFAPELEDDVQLALEHVIHITEKRFIPEMDRLSDIKILNDLENKTVEHNGLVAADDMWLRKLALAWMAQDPIYEELYTYICDMCSRAIASHDEYERDYIWLYNGIKQLYIKLNGLPKLENTLLI